jgi:hypothetical protein
MPVPPAVFLFPSVSAAGFPLPVNPFVVHEAGKFEDLIASLIQSRRRATVNSAAKKQRR